MKGFYYDTLLDEENICNLDHEKEHLKAGIHSGKKLVVFGPRNFGKTSLVKNVLIPAFQREHKESFVLFADLMEVKSLDAIHQRLQVSFERSFANSFPARHLLDMAKRFLVSLRPQVTIDALSGEPSLALTLQTSPSAIPFLDIFTTIRERIVPAMPTLIVLDEFQDIAFVPEAQGLMRQALQEFRHVPIVVMGSKRHILSKIFSVSTAPLAAFGEDIEFGPIPYEQYHAYMIERFHDRQLTIDFENAKLLQDSVFRIPEAMNIVSAFLHSTLQHQTVKKKTLFAAIDAVVEGRASRYEELLSLLSEKEEEILISLAHHGSIEHPTGQAFLRTVRVSQRSVKLIVDYLMDHSLVERTEKGYRIADPLLFHFLKKFR